MSVTIREEMGLQDAAAAVARARVELGDAMVLGCFDVRTRQLRPRDYVPAPRVDPDWGKVMFPRGFCDEQIFRGQDHGRDLVVRTLRYQHCEEVGKEDVSHNLITNVGRVQAHKQVYGTSGLLTNGFNYGAVSNDAFTEDATSTVLSNEIAANGLSRVQFGVTLASGTGNTTTLTNTFTDTRPRSRRHAREPSSPPRRAASCAIRPATPFARSR